MARSKGVDALLGRAREKSSSARSAPMIDRSARHGFLSGFGGKPRSKTAFATDPIPASDEPEHIQSGADAISAASEAPAGPPEVTDAWTSKIADSIDVGEDDEGLLGDITLPGFEKNAEKNIFRAEDPHPMKLVKELMEMFGEDWLEWEPEMLWLEIKDERGKEPTRPVKDTIQAMLSLLRTESFWQEHHVFLHMVEALNGRSPDFSMLPEPSPEELAFAVTVANEVRDSNPVKSPNGEVVAAGVYYGNDVVNTIATCLFLSGLVYAPRPFQGHGETDGDTGLLLPSVNDALAALMGEDGKVLQTRMAGLWKLVEEEGITDLDSDEETPESVQLARLISMREYVRSYGN